ncbi:MAG TPA: signal peptide peptidase SppA [Oscillatoriales cyanobacterium M4454_W2019_049]|nr:signal peptide peptidase SppA [Oscillatoriales cyanobacterium M4454_W2019_049]
MRDFFKYTFASLLGLVLFCGLSLGGLIFLIALAASTDKGPQVKKDTLLVLDLSVTIADNEPASSTSQAIERSLSGEQSLTIPLRTAVKSLQAAATDDRIVGLYIQGSSTPAATGFANLTEVRNALKTFRDSGKPIFAYDLDWTEREYYLGSVANTLLMNPLGTMEINGLGSETLFLAGALQKYGVGVQVVRVGKYKAAVEPFIRQNQSPENRQQTEKLLGDLWSEFLAKVGEYRQLDASALQSIATSGGILSADDAKTKGTIDRVAYEDEVVAELQKLTGVEEDNGEPSFRGMSLKTYAAAKDLVSKPSNPFSEDDRIAVLYAEGGIVDGEGTLAQIGGDRYAQILRKLRLDENVKAIVLRVNSPGGSATASEAIKREVELIAKEKPIIVSMGNVAASGGYWISMKATQIFAEPNTITGSIGVFGLLFNVQKLANDNGMTWDVVKTAPFADVDTTTRPKTPQELAIVQKFVDRIYDRFITEVSASRNLPKPKVNEIAQGRVWSGATAKQIGLVDEIGGLEAAIQAAAQKANLGDNPQVEEYPQVPSFEEQLIQGFFGENVAKVKPDPLTAEWQKLQAELASLREMNDPIGAYTRLPYNFNID